MRPEGTPEEIVRAVADAFVKACREGAAPNGVPLIEYIQHLEDRAEVEGWGIIWPCVHDRPQEIRADQLEIMGNVVAPFVLAAAWPLIAKAERERIARWHEAAAAKLDAVRATEGHDKIPVVWSRHHCYDAAAIRALEDTDP